MYRGIYSGKVIQFIFSFILRHIMSGYNYQGDSYKNVEKGMVLSYVTLAKFLPSRVKGLPETRWRRYEIYRITEDEMNAIKNDGKVVNTEKIQLLLLERSRLQYLL